MAIVTVDQSSIIILCLYVIFFFFFCLFWATPTAAYWSYQAWGQIGTAAANLCHRRSSAESELCLRPTPQLTATPQRGSLTHWTRPEIKPASSWMPIRFISVEPRWEFQSDILNVWSPYGSVFVICYLCLLNESCLLFLVVYFWMVDNLFKILFVGIFWDLEE